MKVVFFFCPVLYKPPFSFSLSASLSLFHSLHPLLSVCLHYSYIHTFLIDHPSSASTTTRHACLIPTMSSSICSSVYMKVWRMFMSTKFNTEKAEVTDKMEDSNAYMSSVPYLKCCHRKCVSHFVHNMLNKLIRFNSRKYDFKFTFINASSTSRRQNQWWWRSKTDMGLFSKSYTQSENKCYSSFRAKHCCCVLFTSCWV